MGTDGIGITTLVTGAGCPLSCRWCINKRLLREAPVKHVTAAELLEQVKVDDLYFRATGGGITFGGGESLLHAAFIRRFREICPAEWRVRVETSLAVPAEQVKTVLDAVDEFIVDCKDMDPEIYRSYTGKDNSLMTANLRILFDSAGPKRITVRVPLIPEYNTKEDQARSAVILRSMGFEKLDLFDYVIRP
jgi:pyruvate formate lyase activating enzyme